MKIPKEYARTTPEQDGLINPHSLILEFVRWGEGIFTEDLEVKPAYLSNLPYRTEREEFVEQLVANDRQFAISYDVRVGSNGIDPSRKKHSHDFMYEALTESMNRSIKKITEQAGIDEHVKKDLLIDRSTLTKWIRTVTVLSLFREFKDHENYQDMVHSVTESILSDQDPKEWKRSKSKTLFRNAFDNGEASLKRYLQDYLDNFDNK